MNFSGAFQGLSSGLQTALSGGSALPTNPASAWPYGAIPVKFCLKYTLQSVFYFNIVPQLPRKKSNGWRVKMSFSLAFHLLFTDFQRSHMNGVKRSPVQQVNLYDFNFSTFVPDFHVNNAKPKFLDFKLACKLGQAQFFGFLTCMTLVFTSQANPKFSYFQLVCQ